MNGRLIVAAMCFLSCVTSLRAQDELQLESVGGVEMVAIPQESPGHGLFSTIIELRTIDPNATIVALTELEIRDEGNGVHHVWLDGPFGKPTPTVDETQPLPNWNAEWTDLDSHLLIGLDMVGGGVGAAFGGVSEDNDGKSPVGADLVNGFGEATTGFGDISMQSPTDAFFLWPEFQSNRLPLVKIVGCDSEVFLKVGVLGSGGVVDAGLADGAAFGYNGNARVKLWTYSLSSARCVPEPSSTALEFVGMFAFSILRRKKHR